MKSNIISDSLSSSSIQYDESLLLNDSSAAKILGIGRTLFRGLNSQGRIPKPIKLGRRKLWSRQELADWIAAGCPPRDKWERMKKAGAMR